MKKYTFIVSMILLFGTYNVSAQNSEKNQVENKEGLEKKEVEKSSKATLKPAEPVKSISLEKRTVQKASVKKKKVSPIKKEDDK